MTKTISRVSPENRVWKKSETETIYYVKAFFDDGSEGDIGSTSVDGAAKYRTALNALVGQPSEFELEPKPDYQGVKQFKLKSYPGKEQGKGYGGGGKKDYIPKYEDTEEGWLAKQRSIYRSVALQQAIVVDGGSVQKGAVAPLTSDILLRAEEFHVWLCEGLPTPSKPQGVPAHGGEGQNATQDRSASQTLRAAYEAGCAGGDDGDLSPESTRKAGPLAGLVNDGTIRDINTGDPPRCKKCFAPVGKRHTNTCMAGMIEA